MPATDADAGLRASRAEQTLRSAYGHARLLVVDDDPVNREIAQELLSDFGLQADAARDGREAVDMARSTRYDLILMDMQMPVMGGLEATRLIRSAGPCAQVPILALTANAFAEDRKRCRDAGMNDIVTKPVDPDGLCIALLHWLQQTPHPHPHPEGSHHHGSPHGRRS